MARLNQWGLLDEMVASSCPPNERPYGKHGIRTAGPPPSRGPRAHDLPVLSCGKRPRWRGVDCRCAKIIRAAAFRRRERARRAPRPGGRLRCSPRWRAGGAARRARTAPRRRAGSPRPAPQPAAAAHQLRRARAGDGRGEAAARRTTRLLTLTGAGGVRQDAPGAAGRGRGCWRPTRTGCGWSSWRRWPTRRWCRRRWPRRWACARSRGGRCWTRWPTRCARRQLLLVLDNCEHLVDGVRAAGRRACSRACPALHDPGDQPRGAGHRRRDAPGGCRRCRCPTPTRQRPPAERWRARSHEAVRLFVERARAAAPSLRADRAATPPAVAADLPPAGRHPAGARAGGGAGAGAGAWSRSPRGWTTGSGC